MRVCALGRGLGHRFSRLKRDLESLGSLQDDVSLEPEVGLLDGRSDSVVPQNRREQDLQFQHGVFAAHTGTRTGRERHERVVMTIGCLFRQEVVWVKHVRVRIDVGLSVKSDCRNHDGTTRWKCDVGRH